MPSNQQLTWKSEHTGNTFSCQLQNLTLLRFITGLVDPQPFAEWNTYIGKVLPSLSILTENWHIMSQIFIHEYFLELGLLELHHDSLPGVTEVRRREVQEPQISVANGLSLAKQGKKQFLNRNSAPAILAEMRMNGLEMSPRAAFSLIYFTYFHCISLSSLKHWFIVSSIAPVILVFATDVQWKESKERFCVWTEFIEQFTDKYVPWNFAGPVI